MIDGTYKALLLSSKDYGENDKLLRLLTVDCGIITALMRGVKKPTAKLRFGAAPFAFCEYQFGGRGSMPLVTGCSQIEDLFAIANDYDAFTAGGIILEAAEHATGTAINPQIFVLLLKHLKLVLYSTINPYLISASFLQQIIHRLGYSFNYPPPPAEITTVMGLLSLLNAIDLASTIPTEQSINTLTQIPKDLTKLTLIKLIQNFEKKFDCTLKSQKLLEC